MMSEMIRAISDAYNLSIDLYLIHNNIAHMEMSDIDVTKNLSGDYSIGDADGQELRFKSAANVQFEDDEYAVDLGNGLTAYLYLH